jgi:DNA-binding CsgD family transcriptional regulator
MKNPYFSKATKHPSRQVMVEFNGHQMTKKTADKIKQLEPKIKQLSEVGRYNIPDISCRLGISVGTLRNYLSVLNIKPINYVECKRNNMKNWIKIIPHMIANGKTYVEIAKRLKTSDGSISRWVCNNGLSTRKIQ